MAIKRPDIYEHNNPAYSVVDSEFVRGGGKVVANLTALYALSTKVDQLKQFITKVYITDLQKTYTLVDINNVDNSSGWAEEAASSSSVVKDSYNAYTILAATNDNDPQPITIDSNSVFGRIGSVLQSISIDSDLISGTSSNDDTIPSAKAVVAYVNDQIAGALSFNGGYNVLADTTDVDPTKKLQTAPYPTISKGDTYVVTVAGSFFGTNLGVADMIIANQASPTQLSHWTLVIKQVPDIVDASETSKGIIEIATDAEITTGTDDTRAVTPLKLKNRLTTLVSNSVKKYSALIANPSALTVFNILKTTHGLGNTTDLNIIIRDTTTGQIVETETLVNADYSVTVKFSIAPATNKYRITIIG